MSSPAKRGVAWGVAIVIVVIVLGVYFSAFPYYQSQWTVERVKTMLDSEIPVGSSRSAVVNTLRKHSISFSEARGRNDLLNAEIPGTTKFLLKEGSIFIVLTFDEADRLKSREVQEVFTGM